MGNAFALAFLSALGERQPLLLDLLGSCFVVETNMLNETGGERGEEEERKSKGGQNFPGFSSPLSELKMEGIKQGKGGREVLDIWKILQHMLLPC